MKTTITFTVTAPGTADILTANRASFYGINGNANACAAGRRAATKFVTEYLADHGIDWNGFNIIAARTIDTTGTKTPYKAEITALVDIA